jgi:tRNA uridine 5-carboxymethylaminomethyl modification enzyme
MAAFELKASLLEECRVIANTTRWNGAPISQQLKRPGFRYVDLPSEIRLTAPAEIWELIETDIKYEGYTTRQAQHNKALSKKNLQRIPDGLNFATIAALRAETRQKLSKIRPLTLGQAARISGVTPADISILSIWLTKNHLNTEPYSALQGQTDN